MSFDPTERILQNQDKMNEKIDGLTERTTRMEEKLEFHFVQTDKEATNKQKRNYYLIALIGIGFTSYEVVTGIF